MAKNGADKTKIIIIESDDDEDIIDPHQHSKTYPCKECGKVFASGKSLGGHMSSGHVQSLNRKQKQLKKSPNRRKRRLDTASSSSSMLIKCDSCDEKFRSDKALFGHMRSHSKREYKGMGPPIELDLSMHKTIDYKSDTDHLGTVLALDTLSEGWSVRGKRGRESIAIIDDSPRVSDSNSAKMFERWMMLLKFVSGEDHSIKKTKVSDRSGDVRIEDCNNPLDSSNDGNNQTRGFECDDVLGRDENISSSNALINQKVDTTGRKEEVVYYDIVDKEGEDDDDFFVIRKLEKGCKSGKGTSRNILNAAADNKTVEDVENDLEIQEKIEGEEEEEARVVDQMICEETNVVRGLSSSDIPADREGNDDESYARDYCKEAFTSREALEGHKCRLGFDLNEPYELEDE